MILKSLSLKNFGPYRGTCVVNLAPTLGAVERPICLIGALNGSGKTSLLDGIVLALYGPRARCSTRTDLNWKDFLYKARNSFAPTDELASSTPRWLSSSSRLCVSTPNAAEAMAAWTSRPT